MTASIVIDNGTVSIRAYDKTPLVEAFEQIGFHLENLDSVNEFRYGALPEGSFGRFLVRSSDAYQLAEGELVSLTLTGNVESFSHNHLFVTKITHHSVPVQAWTLEPAETKDNKLAIVELSDLWTALNSTVAIDFNRVSVFNPINTDNPVEPEEGDLLMTQEVLEGIASYLSDETPPEVEIQGFPATRPVNVLSAGCTVKEMFQFIAECYIVVAFVDRGTDGAGKIKIGNYQPTDEYSGLDGRLIASSYGTEALPETFRTVFSQMSHPFSQERSTALRDFYPNFYDEWANLETTLAGVNDTLLPNNPRFQNTKFDQSHYFPFYEANPYSETNLQADYIQDSLVTNYLLKTTRCVDLVVKDIKVVDPSMTIQSVTYKMCHNGEGLFFVSSIKSTNFTKVSIPPMMAHVGRGFEYVPPMVEANVNFESGSNVLGGSYPNSYANMNLANLGFESIQIPVWNASTQQTFEGDNVNLFYHMHRRHYEYIERFSRFFMYFLVTPWFGGLAIAYRFSMDGVNSGKKVLLRDPLGIFSYQKAGDPGYMVYTENDAFYAIQAPCNVGTPPDEEDPTGACCYSSASGSSYCLVTTASACFGQGTYKGDGTTCSPDPCPEPTGACCYGSYCIVKTAALCTSTGGVYKGNGTSCSTPDVCFT